PEARGRLGTKVPGDRLGPTDRPRPARPAPSPPSSARLPSWCGGRATRGSALTSRRRGPAALTPFEPGPSRSRHGLCSVNRARDLARSSATRPAVRNPAERGSADEPGPPDLIAAGEAALRRAREVARRAAEKMPELAGNTDPDPTPFHPHIPGPTPAVQ